MNEISKIDNSVIEKLVTKGDLSGLTEQERTAYYYQVCNSIGLNPVTKPFDYIKLQGKLTLYCTKGGGEQIRNLHKVSVQITNRQVIEGAYVVSARASLPDGRSDESTGVVTVAGLKGDHLANAMMKAETKAKRRVTLSLFGLGVIDETELDTVQDVAQEDERKSFDSLPVKESPGYPTKKQLGRLYGIAKSKDWTKEQFEDFSKAVYMVEPTVKSGDQHAGLWNLSKVQYEELCDSVIPNYTFAEAMKTFGGTSGEETTWDPSDDINL